MARHEADREDLLREATALVERVEFELEGYSDPVVVGFRRDGAGSVYFGAAPVYQFNQAGELRRAFDEGLVIKAEAGQLVGLRRCRTAEATTLERDEFTAARQAEFLSGAQQHLDALYSWLATQQYRCVGQVPPDRPVIERVVGWLQSLPRPLVVATAPGARAS